MGLGTSLASVSTCGATVRGTRHVVHHTVHCTCGTPEDGTRTPGSSCPAPQARTVRRALARLPRAYGTAAARRARQRGRAPRRHGGPDRTRRESPCPGRRPPSRCPPEPEAVEEEVAVAACEAAESAPAKTKQRLLMFEQGETVRTQRNGPRKASAPREPHARLAQFAGGQVCARSLWRS